MPILKRQYQICCHRNAYFLSFQKFHRKMQLKISLKYPIKVDANQNHSFHFSFTIEWNQIQLREKTATKMT